ncbi:hypothetical protein CCP4SC76_2940003 [Gammaproteobacteria bacterium]
MIQAEIHSKLNIIDFADGGSYPDLARKEDILTSNVFGILKNLDVGVLNSLFRVAELDAQLMEDSFRIAFWPRFEDGTEPDILIQGSDFLVVIEVKYLSDFDRGSEERAPQILREFNGAQAKARADQIQNVFLLAVTREPITEWKDKVRPKDQEALQQIVSNLRAITWSQIYDTITTIQLTDRTSVKFLADLKELMEIKQIGYCPPSTLQGQRDFLYFFGQKASDLATFLAPRSYQLVLSEIPLDDKLVLYKNIQHYIEECESDQSLRVFGNTLSTDTIPVDLLLGVPPDELEHWVRFMLFLYTNDHVNLNGRDDCSVKLHFSKGNYTKSPVSLFTYRRSQRIIKFQEKR